MADPELTPAREAQVRRVLADARHTDPMPADVVTRLDAVLAGLATEDARASAPVISIAAPRGRIRRRWAGGLAAAAAVAVLGYAVPQVVGQSGGTDSASTDRSVQQVPATEDDGPTPPSGAESRDRPTLPDPSDPEHAKVPQQVFELHPQHLRSDLRELTAARPAPTSADRDESNALSSCKDPGWGPGERVAIVWQDQPGVAVLREPDATGQRIDVYLCGESEPVRSDVVPEPSSEAP